MVILGDFNGCSRKDEAFLVANAKLRQLDAEKTQFLSIATHQIMKPLTVIRNYSSLLMEGSYGELAERAKATRFLPPGTRERHRSP